MTAIADRALLSGLPSSAHAEQLCLSAAIGLRTLPPSLETLGVPDFTTERRRTIFRAIRTLVDLGKPVDLPLVAHHLDGTGELNRIDGVAGLDAELALVPPLKNVDEYAAIVHRMSKLRRFIEVANQYGERAMDAGADPNALIEALSAKLDQIRHSDRGDAADAYGVARLEAEFDEYANAIDQKRIRLGLAPFDKACGGLAQGQVLTLLARTGVGKSAVAQNVLQRVLDDDPEGGAVFFSLEMLRTQAYQRQLQIYAKVQADAVVYSFRNLTERARREPFRENYDGRLLINDDVSLDLGRMARFVQAAQASRLVAPVRLVVIDYLGMLDRGGRGSTTERVSQLAREVKQFAKLVNAAVFLICQTSRAAGDGSQEVTITDARDSGAVEDSADFLVGAWRPDLRPDYEGPDEGTIRFAVLKAREGARVKWSQTFDGPTLRLGEVER